MTTQSILGSVKKVLGIDSADTDFDVDIVMHINSAFATLQQLGVGPVEGFMIEDATPTWDLFLGTDPRLNNVKTYTYLRVRFVFDPPQTSFHLEAMKEQIREYEWRINAYREETGWVDPDPEVIEEDDLVLDGGGP